MAVQTQILHRRDTAANWTSVNPTLAGGEIGFETDTGKFKIGTGSATWTSLTYATDASKVTGATLASNVTASSLTSFGSAPTLSGTVTLSGLSTGVVHAGSGGALTSSTIVDADVSSSAAIAATKISGTAYTVANKKVDEFRLANTLDIVPRAIAVSNRTVANGTIYFSLFTPLENITVSNISVYCVTGATDTGGTTVRRMGLFTATGTDNTTMTLVANTASDATIGATTATLYTRALTSSYALTAGTTYAFGIICYNTGGTFNAPNFMAHTDVAPALTPYRFLQRTSQSDLVSTTGQNTGITSSIFARLT